MHLSLSRMRATRVALVLALALWVAATLAGLRLYVLPRFFPALSGALREPAETLGPRWPCPRESRARPLSAPPCSHCDAGCCASHCACALCCALNGSAEPATCAWRCRTWSGSVGPDGRAYARPDRPHCYLAPAANREPPGPRERSPPRPDPPASRWRLADPPAPKSAPPAGDWIRFGGARDE